MGTSQNEAFIELAIAPSDNQEVFAAITNPATQGLLEMLKSTDGGTTWSALSNVPNYLCCQGDHDSTLAVDPSNANIVYAGGTTALDYSGDHGRAVTVSLATGAASLTGGISGITKLTGSTASDTLIGPDGTVAWSVTAHNAGKAGTLSFTSIENLEGGSGANTFKLSNGQGVSGSINGGSGTSNVLDYSAWTTGITVNLGSGTATETPGCLTASGRAMEIAGAGT
jgi:hypothetical protein